MRIFTNIPSLQTRQGLGTLQSTLAKSIERLSSGLRINSAADDAAGQGIANRMESKIRGKAQAMRNVSDAQSMLATLDSGIGDIESLIQRIRELAVKKASDTNTISDRVSIQAEIDASRAEIDRLAANLNFNGINIGSQGKFSFQIGESEVDSLSFNTKPITSATIGLISNALPNINEPASEIIIPDDGRSRQPGTYAVTDETFNVSFFSVPGSKPSEYITLAGRAEIANYFGVPVDSVQMVRDLSAGQPVYLMQIGETYYYNNFVDATSTTQSATSWINDDGSASARIRFGFNKYYWVEGGDQTEIDVTSAPAMGIDTNGNVVRYIEYNDKKYQYASATSPLRVFPSGEVELAAVNWIEKSDNALQFTNDYRAYLGAMMNRLDSIKNGLSGSNMALQAAQSRIQDTDYAAEISNMTRTQILQQAGNAVLAQANQIPIGVLSLLQ
ncbi:hypothetical protein W822_09400 [Advenella kashmirensis W13003]|uniref:Flagellin n=1 Tax=Advenella kashmirensis W13003 TaxID=1424334 RepID=V8QVW2_9BURK|nr:flagellin [Advenella kashmirensis]ETF03493.1 hypothetical protein W822_09400 [Advenella kashmirensis W13003]